MQNAIYSLQSILLRCAIDTKKAKIKIDELCEFVRDYSAEHYLDSKNLGKYRTISEEDLLKELEVLAGNDEVELYEGRDGKTVVCVFSYYTYVYENVYKRMESEARNSYPSFESLGQGFPSSALKECKLEEALPMLKSDKPSYKILSISLPHSLPVIIYPKTLPAINLVKIAIMKLYTMLIEKEHREYFLQKLRNANPNRTNSVNGFFSAFIKNPSSMLETLDGDAYYYWNQLCYFIRQDFEKGKANTSFEINVWQSITILELWFHMVKEGEIKNKKKEEVFRDLDGALARPPYFFTLPAILRFKSSRGTMIKDECTDAELQDFLKILTEAKDGKLPELLSIKIGSTETYFVKKSRVFPLIMRLANEAHDAVKEDLTMKWFYALRDFEKLPEMKDKIAFESAVHTSLERKSPVLNAILNAPFLPALNYEVDHSNDVMPIFIGGQLVPFSKILLLNPPAVLVRAKSMLPFWHFIPVISRILMLFRKRKQEKAEKKETLEPEEFEVNTAQSIPRFSSKLGKRGELRGVAAEICDNLIPQGTTLERELSSYLKRWNKMITKEGYDSLIKDVNSLIYDYIRRIIKTITPQTLNEERIDNLAKTLCKTPNMKKIDGKDNLFMYVKLYILQLLMQ